MKKKNEGQSNMIIANVVIQSNQDYHFVILCFSCLVQLFAQIQKCLPLTASAVNNNTNKS